MFYEFPYLTILILLPLLGVIFISLLINGKEEDVAASSKKCALWTSGFTFIFSLAVLSSFDPVVEGFQLVEKKEWIKGFNINYGLGIDGISLVFIMLTTFLIPICILASWNSIQKRVKEFMVAFLLMESFILGVFSALDFVVFYIFFEAMLIPMFFLIGIWGGENKIYAAFKFFLYTLIGSVLLLIALVYIYQFTSTTDIPELMVLVPKFDLTVQKWLWLAFFASFAVKIPMWPVHTWLPDAHVQAPTAGSVILAGVLLKMGAYGFLRFSLPMLPDASIAFAEFVFALSVVAVIYTSLVALAQKDMKKLIAYSSIAHMGYVTIGIFSFNVEGIQGAIIQMISHGFVAAALFLVVGVLYDRMHTKEIDRFGGVTETMPVFAALFLLFTLASVGLPGTSGFVGEFLALVGIYQVDKFYAILTSLGMVLGAAYMLYLYKKVMFGVVDNDEVKKLKDVDMRERSYLGVIAAFVIFIGIYPTIVTSYLDNSVEEIIRSLKKSESYKLAYEIEDIQIETKENLMAELYD